MAVAFVIAYLLLAVGGGSGQQDCSETHTVTGNQFLLVPPGAACFQCDFGSGVATDSVFQLNNAAVGADEETVQNGVLTVSAAENVFVPKLPTTLSCTSGTSSMRLNAFIFLKSLEVPIVPATVSVTEGETLTLACDVSNSNPAPAVSWITAEEEVVSGSTVVIEDIQRSQSGNYICIATADDGSIQSSTTAVTVTFAPEITADIEGLVKFPLNGELQLTCSFQGVPPPDTVTWTHNGTELSPTLVTVTATDTTLTRTSLPASAGGAYACSASNEVGSNTANTFVRIQLPPGVPSDLRVAGRATESLTISWTNPDFTGFASLTSFRVTITGGAGAERTDVIKGDEMLTGHTVSSLSPLTHYNLSLTVVNDAGLESLPSVVQESTLSLRLAAVEEPTITAINSTAIQLQWQPPRYDPATTYSVTHYQLSYRRQSGGETGSKNLSSDVTSWTVGNLAKGTVYVFTLIPFNTAGGGAPFTYRATETIIDPPGVPRNFTASAPNPFTIELSWSPPGSDGGRPIDEYRIQLLLSGQPPSLFTAPGSALTYRIEELTHNKSYEMRVTAVNTEEKESNYASVAQTTPPIGDPQAPLLITFSTSRVGNTFAVITWDIPGGYPHQYIIQFKQSTQENWTTLIFSITIQLYTFQQSVVIEELRPLTMYHVRVQSENINGLSEFTEIFTFSTYGDVEIRNDSGGGVVSAGSTLTLRCGLAGAGSDAIISYNWTTPKGPLPSRATVNEDGVLVIRDVKAEDGGVYVCTANGVTGSVNITVELSESSSSSVNVVWIVIGGAGALIIFTLIICALFCIVMFLKRSPNNKVVVEDIDGAPPMMDRSSHVYESLPLNNIGIYNNPTTFMPDKAYTAGATNPLKDIAQLPQSLEDEYVEVRGGVKRVPEEIYDLAVCGPSQQQQTTGAEESEEEFEETCDTDSDDAQEACTNL